MIVRHLDIELEELPLPGDAGELCQWAEKQPGMDHGLARALAVRALDYVTGRRARIFAPKLNTLRASYFDEWELWPKNPLKVEPGWAEPRCVVLNAYQRAWDRFVAEVGPDPWARFAYLDDFEVDAPAPEEPSVLAIPVQGVTTSTDASEIALPSALVGRLRALAESQRYEFRVEMDHAAWNLANRWAREWRGDYDPTNGWRLRLLKALLPRLAIAVDSNQPKATSDMVILARDLVEGCDSVAGYANVILGDLTKVVPFPSR